MCDPDFAKEVIYGLNHSAMVELMQIPDPFTEDNTATPSIKPCCIATQQETLRTEEAGSGLRHSNNTEVLVRRSFELALARFPALLLLVSAASTSVVVTILLICVTVYFGITPACLRLIEHSTNPDRIRKQKMMRWGPG